MAIGASRPSPHSPLRTSRSRGKTDSPMEERVSSELVSEAPKFPASRENTAGARPRRRSGDQGVNPGGGGAMKKTEDQPRAPSLSGSVSPDTVRNTGPKWMGCRLSHHQGCQRHTDAAVIV